MHLEMHDTGRIPPAAQSQGMGESPRAVEARKLAVREDDLRVEDTTSEDQRDVAGAAQALDNERAAVERLEVEANARANKRRAEAQMRREESEGQPRAQDQVQGQAKDRRWQLLEQILKSAEEGRDRGQRKAVENEGDVPGKPRRSEPTIA
ncbi:MAG TPA: hypothetical protein VGG33_08450 [Polyangia bacterium]